MTTLEIDVFRHELQPCPHGCGYELDAVTGTEGDGVPPSDGDISFCASCTGLLRWEGARWEALSDTDALDELVRLRPEQRDLLQRARAHFREHPIRSR